MFSVTNGTKCHCTEYKKKNAKIGFMSRKFPAIILIS